MTTGRDAVRQRYLGVDTATVADVLDTLGMHEQGLASAFTPFPADCGAMAGWGEFVVHIGIVRNRAG